MLLRHERILLLNCFKFKRRFDCEPNKLVVRWNSSGLKILFFGTDNFSLPSLQRLNEESHKSNNIQTVDVVTSFKKPKNPVLKYAESNELTLHKWPLANIAPGSYNLGVVVSFGHLIPERVISLCSLGIINVHASLLPRWRGAAPIIYALKNGDRKTGVTIMKIEPKHFDVGGILAQREMEIHDEMLMPELHEKMAQDGANLLVTTVQQIPGILTKVQSQDHRKATYAPKITPDFCEVNWHQMSAPDVFNLYRSLYSYKSVTTKWQSHTIKLVEVKPSTYINGLVKPGFVEYNRAGKSLRAYCRHGTCIEITKICIEGRKAMTAMDFNNGFLKACPMDQRYFRCDFEFVEPLERNLKV